ncbi:DUF416 family protein [Dyella sp.]|uniref:DUF416 family protein n=1 Tax=Dyella sp. TaxID=1869338 RepID=UPI002D799A1C|nr:DUF416 family protein [Dyella sp.]HET7329260.1 DUF416 family protein [Dyella sp.]
MTFSFDITAIKADLESLDEIRRVAFGTLLLERALPNYLKFQIDSGATGGAVLRAALAQCWATIELHTFGTEQFLSLAACEKVLPDSEDYSSPYTSAAIDATNIACCLLEYLEGRNLASIVEAVQSRWDTLYLFIINHTSLGPEDVLSHPLMQQELRFVHQDIVFLQGLSRLERTLHVEVLKRIDDLGYREHRLNIDQR